MNQSYYEIETTCKRAARASGFSWGVAEEIGKSIRSLEMMGLPGVKTFYNYLEDAKAKSFTKAQKILPKNTQDKKIFCPIKTSVAILDDCKNLFQDNAIIEFSHMCHPLLLVPMINRASILVGKKILISFDQIKIILNFNESITLNSDGPFPNQTTKVLIQSINDDDKYTNEEYEYLYQLSLETFVDESEGKLSGAGAGLTDND
ncbi:DUF3726 domain-containing protein [Alphaproteobacteria bacterium]|nr:DUF3726 domain-containing protein [Alphaproteobacteria bacterium]MDB4233922.1 DUF3726 domain-containing protein [Alphaproteobacteria bacterium]